jgi:urease accessory protein
LAQAHPGHNFSGFDAGLAHPLHGIDHILAMVAVGLWAVQLGGRALWLVPAAFVSVMTLGGALGMAGISLPGVEVGIAASVLILGLLTMLAVRLPLGASMAIAGLFALCHGFAHGAEMPVSSAGLDYALGFILATAFLHAAGLAMGMGARALAPVWQRVCGAGVFAGGLCLVLA